MGLMRFLVPERQHLAENALGRIYLSGLDEIPWKGRAAWNGDELTVKRLECDSGNLHVPWQVQGHGEVMLSTGSLMERDRPYHLPVELARGTINKIRNHLAAWQSVGLTVPEKLAANLRFAQQQLAQAAVQQQSIAAADKAQQALAGALDVLLLLSTTYSNQALAARRQQAHKTSTLLGVNLGGSLLKESVQKEIVSTFNMGCVPLVWRQIEAVQGKHDWSLSDRQVEWCRLQGLKICGGPLLQLDKQCMPDWLYLWEGDEESLQGFIVEYLRAAVNRYRGKVNLWHCAARMNVNDMLSLEEEQRLRLAVLAIETIRQADPRSPVIMNIDQPWAEFMGQEECDLSPLHFADALVRAELGLSGIALEINFGYWPQGTQPHDLLDFSRQLDRWSSLGLPLLVVLTAPSSDLPDSRARASAKPVPYGCASGPTPASQALWVERLLPLLSAKQPVQGIIWRQLLDSQPHEFPHGGLFDEKDEPKPVLSAIRKAMA